MYSILLQCPAFYFRRKNSSPSSQLIAKCRCCGRCQDTPCHLAAAEFVRILEPTFDIVRSCIEFLFWGSLCLRFPKLMNIKCFHCSEVVPWAEDSKAATPFATSIKYGIKFKTKRTRQIIQFDFYRSFCLSAADYLFPYSVQLNLLWLIFQFQSIVWTIQKYEKAAANTVHFKFIECSSGSACNTCCFLGCFVPRKEHFPTWNLDSVR